MWASGFRARDGQRTSVLGAAPGASEEHAVWLATPEQVAVLDRCEGRGDRYRLARLGTGAVHTDDGLRIEAPWCYLGLSAIRRPLLVDGRPVRCADLDQAAAFDARRRAGAGRRPVGHHRARRAGPRRVARRRCSSTGRCSRASRAWPLLAEHAVGQPRRATVAGQVCDTGFGYPALLPDGSSRAPGWVVTVRRSRLRARPPRPLRGLGVPAHPRGGRHRTTGREPPAGRTRGRRTTVGLTACCPEAGQR